MLLLEDVIIYNFKLVIFTLSAYHIITSIVAIFFTDYSVTFYEKVYGFRFRNNKQLLLSFKPWAALAIFAGLAGFLLFSDIYRYRPLAFFFLILIGLRISFCFL